MAEAKLTELDVDQFMQDIKKKRQQEIENLESRSRHLYELVVIENFTVDEVVAESYATSFTPNSEMIFGGKSPVYRGGFTSRLVLRVTPDNQDVSVRTLNFDGTSIVRAGDYISAQIPRYEKKIGLGLYTQSYDRAKAYYLDRDFNPEESAIELALLSEDGKVLRRDRAINYEIFLK